MGETKKGRKIGPLGIVFDRKKPRIAEFLKIMDLYPQQYEHLTRDLVRFYQDAGALTEDNNMMRWTLVVRKSEKSWNIYYKNDLDSYSRVFVTDVRDG